MMEIYFVTIVTRAQGEHPNKPRIPDGGAQPLRGSNSKTTHYLLSFFFSAQYPEKHDENSRCGHFKAEHPTR